MAKENKDKVHIPLLIKCCIVVIVIALVFGGISSYTRWVTKHELCKVYGYDGYETHVGMQTCYTVRYSPFLSAVNPKSVQQTITTDVLPTVETNGVDYLLKWKTAK